MIEKAFNQAFHRLIKGLNPYLDIPQHFSSLNFLKTSLLNYKLDTDKAQ